MPVRLTSRISAEDEARIEIIPLIDIMFFLLATFMLASIGMVQLRRVPVELPESATAATELKTDLLAITVDKAGTLYLDNTPHSPDALTRLLAARRNATPRPRIIVSGDKDTRNEHMMRALDAIRSAGFGDISFDTNTASARRAAP